jgi:hypothetical protein
MSLLETSFVLWIFGILQFVGLLSAWLARLSEGSRSQSSCQWLFLSCMALVSLTTMVSLAYDTRYWLASGSTLSVMVLAVIWDFRAAPEVENS